MAKTITVRVTEENYKTIKLAADSERRTISNFIENAALIYVESTALVSDAEMKSILENDVLVHNLKKSLNDIKEGRYRIVE